MRIRKGRSTKHYSRAKGGPWDGQLILLPSGGSMVFSAGGHHGRYDHNGMWETI